jgi:hypothetical protein
MLPTLIASALMIPNLIWLPSQGKLITIDAPTKICVESTQQGTLMVFDAENETCHDVPFSILIHLEHIDMSNADSPRIYEGRSEV